MNAIAAPMRAWPCRMALTLNPKNHFLRWLGALLPIFLVAASSAWAHGSTAGTLLLDHPYATPTLPGQTTGAVYFRSINNRGDTPDKLLGANTPKAASVAIHHMRMDGQVMRMRGVESLALPPKSETPMRHGSPDGHHLMLLQLKDPLREGDRFPITLVFEKAGTVKAMVWVQKPREGATTTTDHKHHRP
jgi:hypothetical protein